MTFIKPAAIAAAALLLGPSLVTARSVPAATSAQSGAGDSRCAALAKTRLELGEVVSAEHIGAGETIVKEPMTGMLAALNALTSDKPFCKVRSRLHPTPDSDILVETWLPDAWNGKMLGVGGGGFSGGLVTAALSLRGPLSAGYAGVATDVGHPATESGEWAFGHPEKLVDYAHRGNHLAARASKEVISLFYGRNASRAYFHGCSNGGRDALMEVSRYPKDYDGVIAGAPASRWTALMTSFAFNRRTVAAVPGLAAKFPMINAAVLKKCDALDGVKDGVLEDPRLCPFDPAELQCREGDTSQCLAPNEVNAVRKIYDGPRTANGRPLMAGFAIGGEMTGWAEWMTAEKASQSNLATEYFRWMVHGDPTWDTSRFDLNRDLRAAERATSFLNSDSRDIKAFTRRGGKLILYHGWNDAAIPPLDTVRYFDGVRAKSDPRGKSTRLFMAPGMSHCFGGPGPNSFDMLPELDRWVETGSAPERVIATKFENDLLALIRMPTKVVRTRPLCAWPMVARFDGTGSTDEAENFTCQLPAKAS